MVVSDGDGHARWITPSTADAVQNTRLDAIQKQLDGHEGDCRERQKAVWGEFANLRRQVSNLRWWISGATLLIMTTEAGVGDIIKGFFGV